MPLTVHATIRWDRSAEFTARDWMDHQGRLLDKMSRWLRRNVVPVSFVWLREVGRNYGCHTHMLLHLPHARWSEFKKFMLDAGDFEGGRSADGEAINLSGGKFGMHTERMRTGALCYLLKSLDPTAIVRTPDGNMPLPQALGVDDRGEKRLPVVGKRCGVSYSIGATSRRDRRWHELRTIAELHAALHPPKTT